MNNFNPAWIEQLKFLKPFMVEALFSLKPLNRQYLANFFTSIQIICKKYYVTTNTPITRLYKHVLLRK